MRLVKLESTLFYLLLPIKRYFLLARHQSVWRKKNKHNMTNAKNIFPIYAVKVGDGTYGDIEYYYFGNRTEGLKIGSFCSIAGNVKFLGGGEHPTDKISTYPFSRYKYGIEGGEDTRGEIIVEDDVWICDGCTILSGVKIGQGAIIAANSIVTKDVPPYAIWIRNRVVKYRFNDEVVNKLTKLHFKNIDYNKFKLYCDTSINNSNVDTIINDIIKMS